MITYGQQKLNKKDVRKGTLQFVFSFIILSGLTFSCIYLFFKSSEMQKSEIYDNVENYRNLLSRNEILQNKVDTILYKMNLLSKNEENEIFIHNSILSDVKECQIVMGKDSVSEFKQYASFIKKVNKMVSFKGEISIIKREEQFALRDLNECNNKISTLNRAMSRFQ